MLPTQTNILHLLILLNLYSKFFVAVAKYMPTIVIATRALKERQKMLRMTMGCLSNAVMRKVKREFWVL